MTIRPEQAPLFGGWTRPWFNPEPDLGDIPCRREKKRKDRKRQKEKTETPCWSRYSGAVRQQPQQPHRNTQNKSAKTQLKLDLIKPGLSLVTVAPGGDITAGRQPLYLPGTQGSAGVVRLRCWQGIPLCSRRTGCRGDAQACLCLPYRSCTCTCNPAAALQLLGLICDRDPLRLNVSTTPD